MRFIRLAALVGSLVLLVATAVSVMQRRDELRSEQESSVVQASLLASQSVHSSITRLRQDVHLAAVAAADSTIDKRSLAEELVRFFPGAEACVGEPSGCTVTNLFSLNDVDDLIVGSTRLDAPLEGSAALALIAVDSDTDSLLVVRQVSTDGGVGVVAMRVPVAALIAERTLRTVESSGVSLNIASNPQDAADELGVLEADGDRRAVREVIGTPFAFGSIALSVDSTRSMGIGGDATARYATLFALGTVLLALAGWTFLVERRQLERRATTDELTNLINRREFERVSEDALDMADRFNTGLCVMVIDLNGFKQVNDTLGHQFGDLVLAASAERLVDAVRETDVVGRWGGDEFVILLPGLAERSAVRNSAERIWRRLSEGPVVGTTVMSASIGAAIFPRHGTTLDALMRAADVAMYEAKTTGVSHRIADTIEVHETLRAQVRHSPVDELLIEDGDLDPADVPSPIVSDTYVGADRRRPLVAPAPTPPPADDVAPLPPPEAVPTPTVPVPDVSDS